MEPLDADVPVRAAPPTGLALAAAAAALLATTTGDGLLAAVLVGLAAADAVVGAVAVAAVLGTLARFGSTSLAGIAGAQAVLGPAVAVRPVAGAVGSALLALSVLGMVGSGSSPASMPRTVWAVPVGLLAGVVACGPSATSAPDAVVRLAGAVAGVAAAVLLARRRPALPRWAPPAVAALGLLLTAVA